MKLETLVYQRIREEAAAISVSLNDVHRVKEKNVSSQTVRTVMKQGLSRELLMLLLAKLFSATLPQIFEYGTAAFRVSDINISDAALRKVKTPIHIAHVAYDLPNKLGKQFS